jgi:hypothetical protein
LETPLLSSPLQLGQSLAWEKTEKQRSEKRIKIYEFMVKPFLIPSK